MTVPLGRAAVERQQSKVCLMATVNEQVSLVLRVFDKAVTFQDGCPFLADQIQTRYGCRSIMKSRGTEHGPF